MVMFVLLHSDPDARQNRTRRSFGRHTRVPQDKGQNVKNGTWHSAGHLLRHRKAGLGWIF